MSSSDVNSEKGEKRLQVLQVVNRLDCGGPMRSGRLRLRADYGGQKQVKLL